MMGTALLLLLQTTGSTSPTCTKLMTDYVGNEGVFAFIYMMDEESLAAEKAFADATGDRVMVPKRLLSNAETNKGFRDDGDRLITLMAANGCRMPDHVTSPVTYRSEERACAAARGTSAEHGVCAYKEREVARLMAPLPSKIAKPIGGASPPNRTRARRP